MPSQLLTILTTTTTTTTTAATITTTSTTPLLPPHHYYHHHPTTNTILAPILTVDNAPYCSLFFLASQLSNWWFSRFYVDFCWLYILASDCIFYFECDSLLQILVYFLFAVSIVLNSLTHAYITIPCKTSISHFCIQ